MTTEFKLYVPQQRALVTQAKEVLYGGAAGGGKSYFLRVASILYCMEIPGLICYLFRRTFKEVLANHVYTPGGYLEMLKDLMHMDLVTFSKSDYSFTFKNGSRIQLAHSQYEGDIWTHQGAQIGLLLIDEATHFTPDMIRFIRSRVRLGSLVVPERWRNHFPRIIYTSNPGGVGHHYFKTNFVDFGSGHVFKAPTDEGSMAREYVPAKLTDNKVMLLNDPEYQDKIKGMGSEAVVRAMLDGDWDAMSEGTLSDIWDKRFHICKPFDIPHSWRIDRGYDYGSTSPAATVWFAESDGSDFINASGVECWVPPGTIFVMEELYFADAKLRGIKLDATEQGKRIKQYEKDRELEWRVHPGPADNSIFHKEPGHASIADEMAKMGVKFIRSNKSPGSRITGLSLLRTRLANTKKRPFERPGFIVMSHCTNTIRTLTNLQPDPKNPDDIDTQGEDHIFDVVRYRILQSARQAKTVEVLGA